MKLLLYCTKAKPYLFGYDKQISSFEPYTQFTYDLFKLEDIEINDRKDILNGKIVAECDFEVKEIGVYEHKRYDEFGNWYFQKGHKHNNEYDIAEDFESLLNNSCLTAFELNDYLGGNSGYAIHIKNLHIFDKPYELGKALIYNFNTQYIVEKAPQNMMKVYNRAGECHILISIKPQWLCKILNGEKTIEVRKKVLREMLE